jgi:hypothetical protein
MNLSHDRSIEKEAAVSRPLLVRRTSRREGKYVCGEDGALPVDGQ